MSKVAFYTFGILRESPRHETVRPFWDRGPRVIEAAENTDGFVYQSREQWQNPLFHDQQEYPVLPPDNPSERAPATLSLWEDLESVYAFSYRGPHAEALGKRKEWFVKAEWPTYVAWWVDDDHMPTFEEAVERQGHLHENGPTPYAFDFKTPHGETGAPEQLDRGKIEKRRQSVS